MDLDAYLDSRRANWELIRNDSVFSILIPPLDELYQLATILKPERSNLFHWKLLLLCHRSLLTAAILIAQGEADCAGAITRRAAEMARVAILTKYKWDNYAKWLSYSDRLARWKARQNDEEKVPRLDSPKYDYPESHKLLECFGKELGFQSDASVHFTPEFLAWLDTDTKGKNQLSYFITDPLTIEIELIQLADIHALILASFDECFDGCLYADRKWGSLIGVLAVEKARLTKEFPQKDG